VSAETETLVADADVESPTLEPQQTSAAEETAGVGVPVVDDPLPQIEQEREVMKSDPEPQPASLGPAQPGSSIDSEELIERIANRVVEKLSREVIEKIAWEVIPDLAELMIKEQVEAHFRVSRPRAEEFLGDTRV
jgi:hypothetical protein